MIILVLLSHSEINNYYRGDGMAERTKATGATHTDAGSNLGSRATIFFGQVTVSGEKCRHPSPGHGRYPRVPTKNMPKLHARVTPTVPSPTNKNKQLMAIVAELHDQ